MFPCELLELARSRVVASFPYRWSFKDAPPLGLAEAARLPRSVLLREERDRVGSALGALPVPAGAIERNRSSDCGETLTPLGPGDGFKNRRPLPSFYQETIDDPEEILGLFLARIVAQCCGGPVSRETSSTSPEAAPRM